MIKIFLGLISIFILSNITNAADPLHGTKWKTVDDKLQKSVSIVQFNESSNGILSAKIIQILVPEDVSKCVTCVGLFQNKPLQGAQIVTGLKNKGNNRYEDGKIIDPKNGKTYSFNAQLAPDGKTLTGRGYIGISALGRDQTWLRVN